MTVLTVSELRDRVETPANDAALQALLDRIEAEIVQHIGAPYAAATSISETHAGEGKYLFLRRRIGTVTTVTEQTVGTNGWDSEVLTSGPDFLVWESKGMLERRSASWGARVIVSYVPADDSKAWKEAEVDLARIALSRSALKSESVGGEYSFTAPENWEQERARVLRRLAWLSV